MSLVTLVRMRLVSVRAIAGWKVSDSVRRRAAAPDSCLGSSSGEPQDVHPSQVPGDADQVPFAFNGGKPAQQELSEPHGVLDHPEHRLAGGLAPGVQLFAVWSSESMAQPLHRVIGRRL